MSSPVPTPSLDSDFRYDEYRRLGHLLHEANRMRDGGRMPEALELYSEAIRWIGPVPNEPAWANLLANVYTNLGIALLGADAGDLPRAIDCFDRAISLRTPLLDPEDPWILYGLCAGWMNRADALTRMGGARKLEAAVSSYDTALALLEELPLHLDPQFPRRVVIAWINRGHTLAMLASSNAARSFEEAVEMLENHWCGPDQNLLMAGALANLAKAWSNSDAPVSAEIISNARRSLGLVSAFEKASPQAAEIGLKARHALCRGIAIHLDQQADPAADTLVSEATDAVEEGIALARQFGFQEMACELFAFGCRVYQACQPHFLSEYIFDHLDSEVPTMHTAASNSLWRALGQARNEAFEFLNTSRFPRIAEQLRNLCRAQAKLTAPALNLS